MSNTTHILNKPQTATKVSKKRGRKGNKISNAFENIPTEPVDFEDYAEAAAISTNVLRQVKRHDAFKSTGKVFIRKNADDERSTIWRQPPIEKT